MRGNQPSARSPIGTGAPTWAGDAVAPGAGRGVDRVARPHLAGGVGCPAVRQRRGLPDRRLAGTRQLRLVCLRLFERGEHVVDPGARWTDPDRVPVALGHLEVRLRRVLAVLHLAQRPVERAVRSGVRRVVRADRRVGLQLAGGAELRPGGLAGDGIEAEGFPYLGVAPVHVGLAAGRFRRGAFRPYHVAGFEAQCRLVDDDARRFPAGRGKLLQAVDHPLGGRLVEAGALGDAFQPGTVGRRHLLGRPELPLELHVALIQRYVLGAPLHLGTCVDLSLRGQAALPGPGAGDRIVDHPFLRVVPGVCRRRTVGSGHVDVETLVAPRMQGHHALRVAEVLRRDAGLGRVPYRVDVARLDLAALQPEILPELFLVRL
ncbi:MAG: hypothetical protein AUI14_13010 [Actinobacteria bacterium 13_2_20CM_2_71_6]|nr:MAG: hypothetical protein AUI14_13010 [Actinobacteria bacterium 13_2_20CM_2_71_6]